MQRPPRPQPVDAEIAALAAEHGHAAPALLEILQAMQARRGTLTSAAIADAARALHLPAEKAYGLASFYSMLNLSDDARPALRVCDGPACWLKGAAQAREQMQLEFGGAWRVERTSCLGLCDHAPAAWMDGRQAGPLLADDVLSARAPDIGDARAYAHPRPGEVRVMLARAGEVDPDSIDSAMTHGAYRALEKALGQTPAQVLAEVEASGLTGRGGAGFPTGRKWKMVAGEPRSPKYIVCNADESEPLVFKDRVLIDADPHQLFEGLALAGYAVGAREGFIYIRGEYGPQAERLERASAQAEERGWLGERIRGTEFSFQVHVHRGAGAYICGEETALLESLEGRRGEPRVRPPYPTTHGYRGQPTVVNNVETYASVPAIVLNGAQWYRNVGLETRRSGPRSDAERGGASLPAPTPGTKMYTLLGHVNRPGLFEAPFGLTLRQIIEVFGGGMRPDSTFGFALTGGAAGTFVPPALLGVPIDYASGPMGVSLGAGAFLICDQSVSPLALLRELLHFFEVESCGKCTPCRGGTHAAREILDRMVSGHGVAGDVIELTQLADLLQAASFCGLGQSVAVPMKSALRHFGETFEAAEKV